MELKDELLFHDSVKRLRKRSEGLSEEAKYINYKMSMAFVIYHMAETYESYPLYEKFLNEISIILRFNYIAKTHLVVALLAMGRDTEAYGTLKYFMLGIVQEI